MSGHWPPEREDSEEEFTEGTNQLDTPARDETSAARLSEVAAYLASVPVPSMPDAVEARINAALTAEAATRGERPAPADGGPAPADGARNLGPAPDRARVRRPDLSQKGGGDRRRRRFRVRPQVVGGSLLTCLLLAFLGFALSHADVSSSSSSSSAAGSAAGTNNSSAASSAAGTNVPGARPSALGPQRGSTSASFAVTASGTGYQRATLAEQVRGRLAANGSAETGAGSAPAGAAPSAALRGCVLRLTGGAVPRLVDRATYQGEPAYVIASSARVWVVGPGCTAAKTELVVSVALAGLPGNLRALVSVEQ